MMILMSQIEEAFSARPFGFQVSPGLAAAGLKLAPPCLSNSIQPVWADVGRLSHGRNSVKKMNRLALEYLRPARLGES